MKGRNDPCWCGSGQKWKKCHFPKGGVKSQHQAPSHVIIKSAEQIAGIRAAGHLAAKILDATCAKAIKGVTTQFLNDYAHSEIMNAGAIAAPLGYGTPPYPKSICTSLNEVICHGIPDKRPLQEGDILNIDITVILNGYYGDCSKMVVIGTPSAERKLVTNVSFECLMRATKIVAPGLPLSAIGEAIESYATSQGCSVVDQFVGHGVGVYFHEAPEVPHHRNSRQLRLSPGMIFTIEPMINAGVRDAVIDPIDEWTARTEDGRASAQWEYTLLVTETGHEILTPWTVPDQHKL